MIISYLKDNKEWLWSGAGITAIMFIIGIIKKLLSFFINKWRLTHTPGIHFYNTYKFPIYSICSNSNERDEPTQDFIINCSIKNHSLLIKKLRKKILKHNFLIWIDIDKFTQINNIFGRECGDIVINTILKILFAVSKNFNCEVYHAKKRDEFFIIMLEVSSISLRECAQEFILSIQQYNWSKIVPNMFITCSAGISSNTKNSINTLKKARVSLELAKQRGGNCIGPEIVKLHPYELVDLSSS